MLSWRILGIAVEWGRRGEEGEEEGGRGRALGEKGRVEGSDLGIDGGGGGRPVQRE